MGRKRRAFRAWLRKSYRRTSCEEPRMLMEERHRVTSPRPEDETTEDGRKRASERVADSLRQSQEEGSDESGPVDETCERRGLGQAIRQVSWQVQWEIIRWKQVLERAERRGELEITNWVRELVPCACSDPAMEDGAVCHQQQHVVQERQQHIVQELVLEQPLEQLPTEKTAVLHFRSTDPAIWTILQEIVACRATRYPHSPDVVELPTPEDDSPRKSSQQFVLTSVCKLMETVWLPDQLDQIISDFLLPDASQRFSLNQAAKLGFVLWLRQFDTVQNAHMLLAAQHGELHAARQIHEHLAKEDRLECSKNFICLTLQKGDLEYVQWHMHACTQHTLDEWVYAATLLGRVDVMWSICRGLSDIHESRFVVSTTKWTAEVVVSEEADPTLAFRTSFASDDELWCGQLEVHQSWHDNRSVQCVTNAMDRAAKEGNLVTIEWLHINHFEGSSTDAMDWAAENGHLEVIKWLHANRNDGCSSNSVAWAAENGHLAVLEWLHVNAPKTSWKKAMKVAAQNNHWDVVEWIHMKRIQKCPASVLTTAIQQGQFELVKMLYDQRELKYWPRPKDASVLVKLVYSDDEPAQMILKHIVRCRKVRYQLNANENPVYDDWVGQRRTSRPFRRWGRSDTSHHVFTSVSIIAGANGIADVLADLISRFLLPAPELRFSDMKAASRGFIFWLNRFSILQNEHMVVAAEHGKLDEARCMHEQLAREDRLACSMRFLQVTIKNGDLQYVKWHASNCHFHSTEAWVYATTWTGQQHIIEWIHSDQFEVCRLWIPDTEYLRGAGIGSPTELQWLRAYWSRNGTAGLVDEAARHGFLSVFRWWRANGFEWYSSRTMDVVARYGHLSLLQWLHENQVEGCSSSAMDWAARKGHLAIVKWLHTHRSEGCSVKAMDWAAKNGDFAMVSWLHANRPEGSSTDAMDWAAANGNLMMLNWLHENRTEGCTRFAIDKAAQNNHWDVVVWLLEHRDEGCTVSALVSAVRSHQLEVAKMLYDRPELQSFPTPGDARMLVDLIDFSHPDVVSTYFPGFEKPHGAEFTPRKKKNMKTMAL